MAERRVDMDYLIFAWQDESPDNAYYLDTKFGSVKLVNRHLTDLRDLTDDIEKTRERYLYVPKPERATQIDDLKDFAKTVTDEKLQNVLAVAFESPHVLSAFKKILEKSESDRARLGEFLQERVQKRINTWLKANSVPESWEVDEEDLDEEYYEEDEEDELDFSV